MLASAALVLLLHRYTGGRNGESSTKSDVLPLTQRMASPAELGGFANTLSGALARLGLSSTPSTIHVIGASDVEDAVDWSSFCEQGHRIVLVGPLVVRRVYPRESCVSAVAGMYSAGLIDDTIDPSEKSSGLASPDLSILFNADLYMPYWRRTLAELLQRRQPVVLTVYCEYEIHKVDHLFKWSEKAFSTRGFAECDESLQGSFGSHFDEHRYLPIPHCSFGSFLTGPCSNYAKWSAWLIRIGGLHSKVFWQQGHRPGTTDSLEFRTKPLCRPAAQELLWR